MQDDRSKVEDATIIDVEPQLIDSAPQTLKRSNWAKRIGFASLLVAISAGGGAWAYRDVLARYFPNDETAALIQKIEALEAKQKDEESRITAVIELTDELKSKLGAAEASAEQNNKVAAQALQSAQSLTSDFSGIKSELSKVQDHVKTMNSVASSGPADPALSARIAQLEQKISLNVAPVLAKTDQAQAFATLKAKIKNGNTISNEWDLLRELPADFPGLTTVLTTKGKTVLSIAELTEGLNKFGPKVPPPVSNGEMGWIEYFGSFLNGLVTIENSQATPFDLALAKAKAFMASGDLGQAVSNLEGADLNLPPELQEWRAQALLRLDLDKATLVLTTALDAQK